MLHVLICSALLALFHSNTALSMPLRANIANLPVLADSQEKGLLVDLIKAMATASPDRQIEIKVQPFNKSLNEALQGGADFHLPLLKDTNNKKGNRGFQYSDVTLWLVKFALYTNKNLKISPQNFSKANIETEMTHVSFFENVNPSRDIVQSLKRVNDGKLDGFIFAALECEDIIKREKLTNLSSQLFRTFEVKFIVPNGKKGEATNKVLSELVDKIKANGEFNKILSPIVNFYRDWKPTDS